MTRNKLILTCAVVLLGSSPALAMTDAECTAAWTKTDANNDGKVTEAEGGRYYASLRVAKMTMADGTLNRTAFLEHCKAGHFTMAKLDPGAPLPGSNSFTEAQAKDRVMAAGFGNVSALTKDANGVWRGTASDASKTVNVAVDYKGNVVTN